MEVIRLKKVCLLSFDALPVPAVQGGAIETLVSSIVKQNEIHNRLNLTVVTPFDEEAHNEAKKYHNTTFVEIKKGNELERLLFKCVHHLERYWTSDYNLFPSLYYKRAFSAIQNEEYDAVIFEGGFCSGCRFFTNIFSGKLWFHLHYIPQEPFDCQGFSHVITVSNYAAKRWAQFCSNKNVAISVVKNGIDTKDFGNKSMDTHSKEEFRKQLGFDEDDFIVLFCGRLIQIKGVKELLEAMKNIDDPKVKLLIVGSSDFGPSSKTAYTQEVEQLAKGLDRRIVFSGFVPNDIVNKFQQIADIQTIPSLCEEGAPLTCLEAMSSGLPLIVTRSGGIQEYVTADNAITVERNTNLSKSLKKAILKLKNNPDLRKRMSKAAQERSKLYTASTFYDNFVATCENA